MKIYIDKDYKCHVLPAEDRREFDVPFFDGKCPEFIEGYRYVPEGERWVQPDGTFFRGEMITPWKDYNQLLIAQLEYDLADADAALEELGVVPNGQTA